MKSKGILGIAVMIILFTALISTSATPPENQWITPTPPAEYLVEQQYDPETYGAEYSIAEGAPIGQEFTPEAGLLVGVAVEVGGEGDATIGMNLREENIGGKILYAASRSISSEESGWLLFQVNPPLVLEPGRTYVVELIMIEGNRTWRANQIPVQVNPFHRGRAIIGGSVMKDEDLHLITYTKPMVTVSEYIYTGAPVVSVSTKTVKEFTTVTVISVETVTEVWTSVKTSVKTRMLTWTETTTLILREYVPIELYGITLAIMLATLAAVIFLKLEEHRRRGIGERLDGGG